MAGFKDGFTAAKNFAQKTASKIDLSDVTEKAKNAADYIGEKANDAKIAANAIKEDIEEKLTELDRMLAQSVTEYNDAYTLMNDKGVQLFVTRSRAIDTVDNIEALINSIANRPKEFDSSFEKINTNRSKFKDSCDFAERELQNARAAVSNAGAGIAAGASVAFMAPTAAMWIATTFGTASTGAAISTLSGAAATNAALAWLGGGAVAAGGAGMAGGNALLAMAGPVGWCIAGATLLTSIIIFAKKKTKLNKEKNEEIQTVKENTERIKEMDLQISSILSETESVRNELNGLFHDCLDLFGKDYISLSNPQKMMLGNLVNNTLVLSALFSKTIQQDV